MPLGGHGLRSPRSTSRAGEPEQQRTIVQRSLAYLDAMLPPLLRREVARLEEPEPHERLDDSAPKVPLAALVLGEHGIQQRRVLRAVEPRHARKVSGSRPRLGRRAQLPERERYRLLQPGVP